MPAKTKSASSSFTLSGRRKVKRSRASLSPAAAQQKAAATNPIYGYFWDGLAWTTAKTWDGTKWVASKTWDGTKWVTGKTWDGTKWVTKAAGNAALNQGCRVVCSERLLGASGAKNKSPSKKLKKRDTHHHQHAAKRR